MAALRGQSHACFPDNGLPDPRLAREHERAAHSQCGPEKPRRPRARARGRPRRTPSGHSTPSNSRSEREFQQTAMAISRPVTDGGAAPKIALGRGDQLGRSSHSHHRPTASPVPTLCSVPQSPDHRNPPVLHPSRHTHLDIQRAPCNSGKQARADASHRRSRCKQRRREPAASAPAIDTRVCPKQSRWRVRRCLAGYRSRTPPAGRQT